MSNMEELRYGGPQADVEGGDDAARKLEERERKKAEVRKRLEEAGNKKKGKKGFLTPERKKKLRKLLMLKAAEDLKRQQLLKDQERVKILQQRTMACPDVDSINDAGKLAKIYEEMFSRLCQLEEEKYDINHVVATHDTTINALNIEVNDLRGKFVKPSLKKVSKYDNKFKKMAEVKGEVTKAKADFRTNLKVVKKESVVTQIEAKASVKGGKPEWSKKDKKGDKPKEEVKEEEEKPKEEAAPTEEEPEEEGDEEEEEEEEEEE